MFCLLTYLYVLCVEFRVQNTTKMVKTYLYLDTRCYVASTICYEPFISYY